MNSIPIYQTQGLGAPLFPKVLWNRPVSRHSGGRLLVVGGRPEGVALLQTIYSMAEAYGLGACELVVPDALTRLLASSGVAHFVPSTPSHTLAKIGLGQILYKAEDYDAMLLAPSAGNNSETSLLLAAIIGKTNSRLIIADDGLPTALLDPTTLVRQSPTLLILTMQEVFKLAGALSIGIHIRPDGGLINKLEIIEDIVRELPVDYVIYGGTDLIIAAGGNLSVTSLMVPIPGAAIGLFSAAWVQNPSQPFEGLTTAAYVLAKAQALAESNNPTDLRKTIPRALEIE